MKLSHKLLISILICTVLPLSVITHELGHAITGTALGMGRPSIIVWPGWQIYPEFDSSRQAYWPERAIAQTRFHFNKAGLRIENSPVSLPQNIQFESTPPVNSVSLSKNEYGWVALMGSGLNWLLSIIALCFLMVFKKNKAILITSTPFVLLYYDLVFYCLLPTFFGLPHWILWGSHYPEPLLALVQIGMGHNLAVAIICLIALLQSILTLKVLTTQFNGIKLRNQH
ncbi:MAG: hypothetical protein ABJK37_09750 [Paraglaciecola sp.]|uniref:hypothetical protein n=1 Tax=Paraglaciecola sp. TaxID=1920173 RepID=UPI0032982942